jgi:hypothetical protein
VGTTGKAGMADTDVKGDTGEIEVAMAELMFQWAKKIYGINELAQVLEHHPEALDPTPFSITTNSSAPTLSTLTP